ncbi:hypothetical protein BbINS_04662 [Bartonella bacilliformis INS]|uniref:Uncharacterized protein n=2 Tax=Bartonella bacilliformis TaxID=774 RepID=A1UTG7_BARBK|nr:hypothetical protein BARBAKC583_0992 [Bartonella bacilliformis KC583]EKS43528.1 hypothetical protein BbINS_04662 [Bartonella bacilliformis INS]
MLNLESVRADSGYIFNKKAFFLNEGAGAMRLYEYTEKA